MARSAFAVMLRAYPRMATGWVSNATKQARAYAVVDIASDTSTRTA